MKLYFINHFNLVLALSYTSTVLNRLRYILFVLVCILLTLSFLLRARLHLLQANQIVISLIVIEIDSQLFLLFTIFKVSEKFIANLLLLRIWHLVNCPFLWTCEAVHLRLLPSLLQVQKIITQTPLDIAIYALRLGSSRFELLILCVVVDEVVRGLRGGSHKHLYHFVRLKFHFCMIRLLGSGQTSCKESFVDFLVLELEYHVAVERESVASDGVAVLWRQLSDIS